MRFLTLVVVTCLSIFATQVSATEQSHKNGLSSDEALVVATRFAATIPIEGSVGRPPTLRGGDWAFPFKVGYAAVVVPDPILVNRRTGAASWAGLAELQAQIGRRRSEK